MTPEQSAEMARELSRLWMQYGNLDSAELNHRCTGNGRKAAQCEAAGDEVMARIDATVDMLTTVKAENGETALVQLFILRDIVDILSANLDRQRAPHLRTKVRAASRLAHSLTCYLETVTGVKRHEVAGNAYMSRRLDPWNGMDIGKPDRHKTN